MKRPEHRNERLHRNRPLILRISFILSLSIVLAAFKWGIITKEAAPLKVDYTSHDQIFNIEATRLAEKKMPTPIPDPVEKKKTITADADIKEVDDKQEVKEPEDFKPTLTPDDIKNMAGNDIVPVEQFKMDPVRVPEKFPEFPGGMDAFYSYVSKNFQYKDHGIGYEGKIYVEFVVDEHGKVTSAKVVRGLSHQLNEEAIRVIQNSPDWKPGKQGSRNVPVIFTLPIQVKLK